MLNIKTTLALSLVALGALARAEGFENVNQLFVTGDWDQFNLSNPANPANTDPWGQGDGSVFPAYEGPADSYIVANYTAAGTADSDYKGNISAWLFAPTRTWMNGDKVMFATRTAEDSIFADRLQVRLSKSGASTFVGWTDESVGNYDTLLEDINPGLADMGYPHAWELHTLTISGLDAPTFGRIGFRYFVTDGGPNGMNSNIVGIDSYDVQSVPEPATMSLVGLAALAAWRKRRAGK